MASFGDLHTNSASIYVKLTSEQNNYRSLTNAQGIPTYLFLLYLEKNQVHLKLNTARLIKEAVDLFSLEKL